jgi:hypothetical protein
MDKVEAKVGYSIKKSLKVSTYFVHITIQKLGQQYQPISHML